MMGDSLAVVAVERPETASTNVPCVVCLGGVLLPATDPKGMWSGRRARWQIGLWLAVLLASVLVVAIPNLAIAWYHPLLAVVIGSLAGVVGLAVLQLGLWRFVILGWPLDGYVGMGFGVLAVSGMAIRVLLPVTGMPMPPARVTLDLLLLSRTIAVGLFLIGLSQRGRWLAVAVRAGFLLRLAMAVGLVLMLGSAALILAGSSLPAALDEHGRSILASQSPVLDVLPGQRTWLLVTNGILGLAFLVASVGYVREAVRTDDAYAGALGMAVTLLTFAQVHSLLFPPTAIGYVSTGAVLRLGAYLVLLFGLVTALREEVAARAAQEERLRLSRELHDGLAQQLGLLSLRLGQARLPEREPSARARDLDAAGHMLDAAIIEARQVLVALRTDSVTWSELSGSLVHFGSVFEANHGVQVDVRIAEAGPDVAAGLQADVLRIAHEAAANAVRHGRAGRIEICAAIVDGRLDLRVDDDGAGFDTAACHRGIGLRSIRERAETRGGASSVTSQPGQGTAILVSFPLASGWE